MAENTGKPANIQKLAPTELSLLKSEELFRHSFGYAAIGMALLNPSGCFMMVNSTLCKMFGYAEEELINRYFHEITHPEDLELDLRLLRETLEGKRQSYQLEKRYVHKNGSFIWAILSVSLVRDLLGKPLYLVSQIQDITERKHMEQELKEHQLRYRSLLRHNPEIICALDEQGKLVSVNPATVHTTGYSEEELVGRSILSLVAEDDWRKTWSLYVNARQGTIGCTEVTLTHKNGQLIVLEISFVPILLGEIADGFYFIAKDITKRKLHEAMIERLHTKNKLILDAVSDGIFGIDEHQGTIFWNEAAHRLTGYTYEEMIGKNAYLVLTDQRSARNPKALEGTYYHNSNETFRKKNGEWFPVEYMTSPIYEHGHMTATVFTFKDITERLKTEEMLRKSEKLSVVGQIAAGVAHEIRNPLTSLKGFIQFLQSGAAGKQEYYEVMLSELSRIELIITEMLVLAKPQMLRYQPKDVEQILGHVVTLLETQAILSNIRFVMTAERNLPLVLCEPNQIKQTFINLLKNAMEAMPDGGQIDIHLRRDRENFVRIEVIDRGCGIPDDVLARLGEPFYTTKEKGTGLGIMISYKIIEDHKGTMQIESKVGVGTIVSIMLPITRL